MSDDVAEPIAPADDLTIKRERSEEATDLLDPKSVFMIGVRTVRQRWFQALMDANDRETKNNLTYKLQVLDEVANSLKTFVIDYKVALRNKR
jgi:hypothetical protein